MDRVIGRMIGLWLEERMDRVIGRMIGLWMND